MGCAEVEREGGRREELSQLWRGGRGSGRIRGAERVRRRERSKNAGSSNERCFSMVNDEWRESRTTCKQS